MLWAIQVKLQPMPREVRTGRLPVSMTIGSPIQPGRQQSSESMHALTTRTEILKPPAAEQIKEGITDFGVVAASCVEVKRPLESLEVEQTRCCPHSHLSLNLATSMMLCCYLTTSHTVSLSLLAPYRCSLQTRLTCQRKRPDKQSPWTRSMHLVRPLA